MSNDLNRLTYLLRCELAVTHIIEFCQEVRRPTPDQVAALRRWRRVRRSLAHDISQARQVLPGRVQIPLPFTWRDDDDVTAWADRLWNSWLTARENDPLNEGVGDAVTLSGKVS